MYAALRAGAGRGITRTRTESYNLQSRRASAHSEYMKFQLQPSDAIEADTDGPVRGLRFKHSSRERDLQQSEPGPDTRVQRLLFPVRNGCKAIKRKTRDALHRGGKFRLACHPDRPGPSRRSWRQFLCDSKSRA